MRKLGLWVSLMIFGWSSGVSAVPIQWTVAEGGNGHWYDIIRTGGDGSESGVPNGLYSSWDDARLDAISREGYLATFTSPEEWAFFVSIYPTGGGGMNWLGGFQNTSSPTYSEPSGGWEWVTGEPWVFSQWDPEQPNQTGQENHLTSWGESGATWNDQWNPYPTGFPYAIEYDTNPIPEPSTALLLGVGLASLAARREKR